MARPPTPPCLPPVQAMNSLLRREVQAGVAEARRALGADGAGGAAAAEPDVLMRKADAAK